MAIFSSLNGTPVCANCGSLHEFHEQATRHNPYTECVIKSDVIQVMRNKIMFVGNALKESKGLINNEIDPASYLLNQFDRVLVSLDKEYEENKKAAARYR